ncbi:MAG: hypothetical protein KGL70_11980, partial [Betaproteobacteria bacterium]|nr:hypothetical protein [Betaproteobacteria bacterium]
AEVTAEKVRLKLGGEFEDLDLKIAAGPKTTVQPAAVAGPVPVPSMPTEAARLQALRAAEQAIERREQATQSRARGIPQPTSVPPTSGSAAGVTSMSEILAERRRAAAAAAAAQPRE